MLDLNRKVRIKVFPARPAQRISEDTPGYQMPERMSEDMPVTYARKNVVRYQVAFVLRNNVRRKARIDARKNVKINAK
jgi:hypothetical protein